MTPSQSLNDSVTKRITRLEKLAELMDNSIRLPGGFRVGLDGLIGLIPFIGDVSTAAVSFHIINEARRIGVPKRLIFRMVINALIDFLLGAIPFVGDIFDFFNKANLKNINLILEYAEQQGLKSDSKRH